MRRPPLHEVIAQAKLEWSENNDLPWSTLTPEGQLDLYRETRHKMMMESLDSQLVETYNLAKRFEEDYRDAEWDDQPLWVLASDALNTVTALNKVLMLHSPIEILAEYPPQCSGCGQAYPCATVRVIRDDK